LVSGGQVTRLHQEDFCQALGVHPAGKYQSEGGPSLAAAAHLLRAVDPARGDANLRQIAQVTAFNIAAGAPDGHAKNHSLLWDGPAVTPAPAYDLIAAPLLEKPSEVFYRSGVAMSIGGHYRFRRIRTRHLEQAAAEMAVDPEWFVGEVRRLLEQLPDAVATAAAQTRDTIGPSPADHYPDAMAAWRRLLAPNLTTAPR
jgi:serine/threonine-protein kinase HipA